MRWIHVVGQVAFHQYIAGEELAFRIELATAPHLDNRFGRHENFVELVGQAALLGAVLDRFSDLFFEVRIGVDDIPALCSCLFRDSRAGSSGRRLRMNWTARRNDLIDRDEEDGGGDDHQANETGGDHGLLAARPGDLVALSAHRPAKT